jgi:hypothetical protein
VANKYVVFNKETGARLEVTEKYLVYWLAKGFEIEGVVPDEDDTKEAMATEPIE